MFEYISVLISVIMGLGITHLVIGASKQIQHRDTMTHYWVHLVWVANVLVHIMAIWWGMFWWNELAEWSFFEYLFITVYAIAMFLLATMLYPWDMEADLDLKAYFDRNRTWFFSIYGAVWVLDIPETLLKNSAGVRDLPAGYLFFVTIMLLMVGIGIVITSERVQRTLPVLWFFIVLGYLGITTLARIAA